MSEKKEWIQIGDYEVAPFELWKKTGWVEGILYLNSLGVSMLNEKEFIELFDQQEMKDLLKMHNVWNDDFWAISSKGSPRAWKINPYWESSTDYFENGEYRTIPCRKHKSNS
jgi:hypothetical protein